MGSVFTQHSPRRPSAVREMVRHGVEGPLHSVRSLQGTQLAKFSSGETPGFGVTIYRHGALNVAEPRQSLEELSGVAASMGALNCRIAAK
jgi:hypothetical protein